MSETVAPAAPKAAEPTFDPVPCSQVKPESVEWLWQPYLPRGKLVVLDGDPGTGKSFLTTDLAARVSRGRALPGGAATKPANVLLLNAEDAAADTLRPRLSAAGADLSRVHIFFAPDLDHDYLPRFPDDFGQLAKAVFARAAALVVLDPLSAFLGTRANANIDHAVRAALSPLAFLAARSGACILLVRHLRKSPTGGALTRGLGSVGIAGAVRGGLVLARHPDDPDLRVLAVSKSNLSAPGASVGFRLVGGGSGAPLVSWVDRLDLSADDLLGSGTPARAAARVRERACEWLRAQLSGGAKRAGELFAAARGVGIPERTLRRAKALAGVRADARNNGAVTEWWWHDPHAEPPASAPPIDDAPPG
jgi:AAA domain